MSISSSSLSSSSSLKSSSSSSLSSSDESGASIPPQLKLIVGVEGTPHAKLFVGAIPPSAVGKAVKALPANVAKLGIPPSAPQVGAAVSSSCGSRFTLVAPPRLMRLKISVSQLSDKRQHMKSPGSQSLVGCGGACVVVVRPGRLLVVVWIVIV